MLGASQPWKRPTTSQRHHQTLSQPRVTMRQYQALFRKAVAGDDYRVAFMCLLRLEKLRGVNTDKNQIPKQDALGDNFKWGEIESKTPIAQEGIFENVSPKELLEHGYTGLS